MKETDEKLSNIKDGCYYWIKYDNTWAIGRYQEKFKQFLLTGRTVYDIPNIQDIDPVPITRK
jgi:hypothetical protein